MKYRVYATILGYTLPKKDLEISFSPAPLQRDIKTVIKKMSFKEQRKRGFRPILIPPPNTVHYQRYLTNSFGSDYKILRSNYVIFTDVEVRDINSAVGAAIRVFDKIVGTLTLNASILFLNKYRRHLLHQNYDYQIVKGYVLEDEKEKALSEKIRVSGWISMPNWPQKNVKFEELNGALLKATLNNRDEVYSKSLHYLAEGDKSFHSNEPVQVSFLNWMKSIEIIVSEFKGKSFPKRLKTAAKQLAISEKDVALIKEAWHVRSNGDFAHARRNSHNYLPPQYPNPRDQTFIPYDINTVSTLVLMKYFELIDGVIEVRIEKKHPYGICERLDELVEVNMGEYYEFHTHVVSKSDVVKKIKKAIAGDFNIGINKIKNFTRENTKLVSLKNDYFYFKINNMQYSIYKT